MRRSILALLFLILLTACGSSKSDITVNDLAIVKVDNDKEIVQYGMSSEDVEKVLGDGEKDELLTRFSDYESGVMTLYREDSVVIISLREESKGVYKTKRGAEVGMTKEQVTKLYGKKNVGIVKETELTFYYDYENKKYLTEELAKKYSTDDSKNIYVLSFKMNDNGVVESIWLSDALAAYAMM